MPQPDRALTEKTDAEDVLMLIYTSGTTGTPKGVMTMLESLPLDLKGRNAVVVGASNIVGRPMALELLLAADVDENKGSLDVVVRRSGGSLGAVSIDFSTRDVSATAGSSASGVISVGGGQFNDAAGNNNGEAEPGETVKLVATVVNAKAGHKIPSGSAEERVLCALFGDHYTAYRTRVRRWL